MRNAARAAGVRRRFAPHQLRHAHALEPLHEGIPLPPIQRQLGHSHLSTTGTYLQGIDSEKIISTVHARRAPMINASAGLALQSNRGSASPAPAHHQSHVPPSPSDEVPGAKPTIAPAEGTARQHRAVSINPTTGASRLLGLGS